MRENQEPSEQDIYILQRKAWDKITAAVPQTGIKRTPDAVRNPESVQCDKQPQIARNEEYPKFTCG